MTKENTVLFDYQEFCELLDQIQNLKSLASRHKRHAEMYSKKIKQVCERVERDFCDSHHFFANWVEAKPIQLGAGYSVVLNSDRKVIFVLLILNRRKELCLSITPSDLNEFYKVCKQAHVHFPKGYFEGE